MTTTDPRPDVDVVALVDADITRAVEESAARTASKYFGSADLAVNLNALRRHVGQVAVQRIDLLGDLAGHYGVPTTGFHVLNAVESDAHDRLHHRYEAAGASCTPSVLDVEHPDPRRLAASTRAPEHRTAPHHRIAPTRAGGGPDDRREPRHDFRSAVMQQNRRTTPCPFTWELPLGALMAVLLVLVLIAQGARTLANGLTAGLWQTTPREKLFTSRSALGPGGLKSQCAARSRADRV